MTLIRSVPLMTPALPLPLYAMRFGRNVFSAPNTWPCRSKFPFSAKPSTANPNQSAPASAKNAW